MIYTTNTRQTLGDYELHEEHILEGTSEEVAQFIDICKNEHNIKLKREQMQKEMQKLKVKLDT